MKLAKSVSLPPDTVARTLAILAQKGSGKTYTAMKLSELMLEACAQVVALDPTGVWWGLKAEGDGPGFPILVMGGAHGDIPLAPTSGAVVADFVVRSGQSVVLDLSAFNSNGEQIRFVTDFAERLFRAKHDSRTPLHLMLDEADSFAPQRTVPGEQRMLGAIEAIVRRGRSRGIGMTLISQRPAVLNKNVLTQADLLIALRVVGVQDHKALGDWTAINGSREEQRQFLDALPSLPTGNAFFWSPAWLGCFTQGKVLKRRTFDSSSTPEGGAPLKTPKLAAVDIAKLSAEILATAEEAKENDPKELRKEVGKLRRENASLLKQLEERVRDPQALLGAEDRENLEYLCREIGPFSENVAAFMASLAPLHRHFLGSKGKEPMREAHVGRKALPIPSGLNSAQMRVLTSLFWLRNDVAVTPYHVAFYANYTVSGHFNNTLGKLRSMGLVSGWEITPEGVAIIPSTVEDKPTGSQLREWMRDKISGASNTILDILIRHGGRRVPIENLAAEAGYTVSGHFNNSLGKLRSLHLAEGGAKEGGVKASDVFFDRKEVARG